MALDATGHIERDVAAATASLNRLARWAAHMRHHRGQTLPPPTRPTSQAGEDGPRRLRRLRKASDGELFTAMRRTTIHAAAGHAVGRNIYAISRELHRRGYDDARRQWDAMFTPTAAASFTRQGPGDIGRGGDAGAAAAAADAARDRITDATAAAGAAAATADARATAEQNQAQAEAEQARAHAQAEQDQASQSSPDHSAAAHTAGCAGFFAGVGEEVMAAEAFDSAVTIADTGAMDPQEAAGYAPADSIAEAAADLGPGADLDARIDSHIVGADIADSAARVPVALQPDSPEALDEALSAPTAGAVFGAEATTDTIAAVADSPQAEA